MRQDLKIFNEINHLLRISKGYWGYDDEFLDSFIKKLGITTTYIDKHTIKLFKIDDRLAGFFNFIINDDGLLELDNFFLHPDYIGQGIGRKLWNACCQTAKELGKDKFILWSEPNAENFYLKMGCVKIGFRQAPLLPKRYSPLLKYKMQN